MITLAIYFAMTCFGLGGLLNIWQIARAPGLADRILALDTMVMNAIALIVLYGIAANTAVYFEVAMLFAMVGFISTVSYCRFILRGNVIE
jgi:multicomponent K+:H+ antiporter subunit F